MNIWDEPLTEERKAELIEMMAQKTIKRGMATPAILALEMHKPVANVLAHGAVAFTPFLAPLFGLDNVDEYTQLASDRKNIEALIRRIEELALDKKAEKEDNHARR